MFEYLPSGWVPDDLRKLDRDSRCEFSKLQVVAPGSWHGVRDQSVTDETRGGWDGQSRTTTHYSDQMCRWVVNSINTSFSWKILARKTKWLDLIATVRTCFIACHIWLLIHLSGEGISVRCMQGRAEELEKERTECLTAQSSKKNVIIIPEAFSAFISFSLILYLLSSLLTHICHSSLCIFPCFIPSHQLCLFLPSSLPSSVWLSVDQ